MQVIIYSNFPVHSWVATVKTSQSSGAGTRAGVTFILTGNKATSGPIELGNGYMILRKTFNFSSVDIGSLISLEVSHDNKGGYADWRLDSVSLCF